jgi:hypothetical protein
MPIASSIELDRVKNLTTGSDILSSGRQLPTEIVEYADQFLIFHLSASAKPGQLVLMTGSLNVGSRKSKFEATGKIASITPVEGNLNRFNVHIQQIDRKIWEDFLERSRTKQKRADEIFTAMRGDDDE